VRQRGITWKIVEGVLEIRSLKLRNQSGELGARHGESVRTADRERGTIYPIAITSMSMSMSTSRSTSLN